MFEFEALAVASIVVKFLLYLGVLKSLGTVLCNYFFKIHLNSIQPELRHLAISFAIIAFVASVLTFGLRGADLTGDISGMVDPEMLEILWQTSVGSSLLYRLIGLVILIVCLLIGRSASHIGLLGGLLALWSFTEIGHVLSGNLWWLKIVLFIHLLAASFWIGVLKPLNLLARRKEQLKVAADLGEQFGKIAVTFVPILILAGIILAYFLVGSIGNLFMTSYGLVLLLKTILVGGLLVLAAANKLRFVPAMRRGDQTGALKLIKSIRLEWIMILAILLVTAIFTSVLVPPS